jgi:hypothetical protein
MAAMAQEESLMEKYSTIDKCSTIELSKDMIRSMGADEGIDTLSAISVEDATLIETFSTEVATYTQGMSKIMTVVQSGRRVTIYATTSKHTSKMVKMVIFTSDKQSAVMVILTGTNIELNNASSIVNINL